MYVVGWISIDFTAANEMTSITSKKTTDRNHQNTNNRLTLFYGLYLFCAVSVYDCLAHCV